MENIPMMKFRQFKLKTNQGWVQNKSPINSKEKLIAFIKKHKAIKAYMTQSFWLNPMSLNGKNGGDYKILSNCFMGSELFFDMDIERYNRDDKCYYSYTLEDIRNDCLKLLSFMENQKEYKFRRIQWSGSHGLHLIYEELTPYVQPHPFDRLKEFIKRRSALLKELPILDTLDKCVLQDPYRIYKVWDSFDMVSGYKVQEMTIEQLKSHSLSSILSSLVRVEICSKRKPLFDINAPDDTTRHDVIPSQDGIGHELDKKGRPKLSPSYRYLWVSSKLYGVKDRFVPFILWDKRKYNKQLLIRLQSVYRLGDTHIFDYGKWYGSISEKTVSFKRLLKILSRADAINKNFVQRRGMDVIRTSRFLGLEGLRPKYLYSCYAHAKGDYSKAHRHYLKCAEVPINEKDNLIGCDLKLNECVYG